MSPFVSFSSEHKSGKMESGSSNFTLDPSQNEFFNFGPVYLAVFSLIDILPFLVGQPAIAKLLWITFKSKKATTILNVNVALFQNLQYWISIVHFITMHLRSKIHPKIQTFLFVYAQVGGPMSLTFVCMERYVAVMQPTSYPLLKKYRFREVGVVAVWFFSLGTAFLNVLASFHENVVRTFPIFWLTVTTVIIVHSSVRIVRALKKCGPGSDTMHPVKKKAFRTVCATLYIVLICYVPVTVCQRIRFSESTYNHVITPVCIFLLSVASVVHPLYYLSTQGKFFTCLKRQNKAG